MLQDEFGKATEAKSTETVEMRSIDTSRNALRAISSRTVRTGTTLRGPSFAAIPKVAFDCHGAVWSDG